MLIICCSCNHVIGCGLNKDGTIKSLCNLCTYHKNERNLCSSHVPLGKMAEAKVNIVHFEKECLGHLDFHIGFHQNKTPP